MSAPEPTPASIRALVYGLGPIGTRIASRLVRALGPTVQVVGAVDTDPAKVGLDLGALLGAPPLHLPVADRLPPELATAGSGTAVAVHATGSSLADVTPQLLDLIEAGWNVVSTCEELSFPNAVDSALAKKLDRAARDSDVSVLGTGVNPGFVMDTLPLVLTTLCTEVRRVEVHRSVDTNARRIPLQQKVGVGLSVDEFEKRAAAHRLGHVGLRQSAHLVAQSLGWPVARYEEQLVPVVAGDDLESGLGPVHRGTVIGQRQWAEAWCAGERGIRFELEMSVGAEELDEITIEGVPRLHQRMVGGVNGDVATEAVVTNLIPTVAAAPPGLLTMADVVQSRWFGSAGAL